MALSDAKYEMIRQWLKDDLAIDGTKARAELVAAWKAHHPEAAREASVTLHPLERIVRRDQPRVKFSSTIPKLPDEEWANDVYQVNVRYWSNDPVFGSYDGMIQLGISTLDGTARHDWREFQAIKSELAGPECEAFELYPAESRLIDPSNYYTLWCFPGVKRLKIGLDEGRRVFRQDEAFAPQRALEGE